MANSNLNENSNDNQIEQDAEVLNVSGQPRVIQPKCQGNTFEVRCDEKLVPIGAIACPSNAQGKTYYDFLEERALLDYWKLCTFDTHKKYRSMLEVGLTCMLNADNVPIVADSKFFDFFNKKVIAKHLPIDAKLIYDIDYVALFVCARKIGYYLGDSRGTPQLAVYQKLVKLLSELSVVESEILLRVLEQKTGPIQLLASNVTLENINWFMNKLKVSNSVSLIHEVCCSPTLTGKFNAIFKLLELHDLLWKTINWEIVQQFVEFVYGMIAWLMEKTEIGIEMAKKGYAWVKAKVDQGLRVEVNVDVPEVVEPQVVKKTKFTPVVRIQPNASGVTIEREDPVKDVDVKLNCACKMPAVFGCNNCFSHWCMECNNKEPKCACKIPQIHTARIDCCARNNNDCLFRAIGSHTGFATDEIKEKMREFIKCNKKALEDEYLQYENPQDFDQVLANINKQMATEVQCETDTVFLLSCMFEFQIAVVNNNTVFVDREFDITQSVCWVHLDTVINHYTHVARPQLKNFTWLNYFGGPYTMEEVIEESLPRVDSEISLTSTDSDSSTSSREEMILKACGIDITEEQPAGKPVAVVKPLKEDVTEVVHNLENTSMGASVKDWLTKTFTDVCKFFEDNPIVGAVTTLIAGVASFLGFTLPILSTGLEKNTLIKRFSEATRSMYYAQKGTEGIAKAFFETIGAVKDIFGISTNQEVQRFKEQVASMYKMANDMSHQAAVNPGEFINDGQKFLEFKRKMEQVTQTYMTLAKFTSKQDLAVLTPIWYALSRAFQDLAGVYNKFMAGLADRQEPVTVWLWGDSDLGKSQLCSFLIDKVNETSNRGHLQTMTISKGPEFWNTYCQQAHIKIDDFMSYVGNEGDLDSLAFFNLATCASYNPSMAHLNDKNTMANPLFVWVCSNYPTISLNSNITNIEAFERRRNVFVHVSWPDHAKCPKGRYDCAHWKGKTVENFDHLTLKICDPNVSEVQKTTSRTNNKFKKTVKTDYTVTRPSDIEIADSGTIVSVSEVIKLILAKEREHHKKFQDVIKRKKAVGALDITKQAQTSVWKDQPNVFLSGPPGTGKSFILKTAAQRMLARNVKTCHITTSVEFDEWGNDDFNPKGITTIIDDLSTHLGSTHMKKFLEKMKARYDMSSTDMDVWIIGVNPGPTRAFITEQLKQDEEYYDMMFRRGKTITCAFKTYWALTGRYPYTAKDTTNLNGAKIEKFVEYKADMQLPQQGVIEFLSEYVPEVEEVHLKDKLSVRKEIKPTISCVVPKTSEEFIKMINDTSVTSIINFLTSSKTELYSTQLSVADIGRRIIQIVRNAKDYLGVNFTTMEDFLLQCWNNKFLTPFKNELILFKCEDASFYIDGKVADMDVGVIWAIEREIDDAITSMAVAAQTIGYADLSKIAASHMPPWFCLIGDLIKTVFMTMTTGVVAASCVSQQEEMHRAVNYGNNLRSLFAEVEQKEMDAVPISIKERLYPGVADVRAAQYASIDEDDILRKHRENITPPSYFKLDKNRQKAEGITPKSFYKVSKNRQKAENKNAKQKYLPLNVVHDTEYADRSFDHNVIRTGKIPELKTECCVEIGKDVESAVAEVVTDPSLPSILKKITSNMCSVVSSSGDHLCHALFVKDNICTTVLHVLDTNTDLRIKDSTGAVWHCDVHFKDPVIDRLDLVITDKSFQKKSDIVAHLAPRSCTPTTDSPAVLVSLSHEYIKGVPTLYMRSYKISIMRHITYAGTDNRSYYHLSYKGHKIGYSLSGVQTTYGDCGSVLIIADPSWTQGKIVAMHAAAGTHEAFGRLLHREHYVETVKTESVVSSPYINPTHATLLDNSEALAVVKYPQHIPDKTKIYRNVVPIGEKVYEPAILGRNDTRNPGIEMLHKESMKWCIDRPELSSDDKNLISVATEELANWYADMFIKEGVSMRVLTKMEAINKLQGCPTSEPIVIKTSAGFPWADISKEQGKRSYLMIDENGTHRFRKGPLQQQLFNAIDLYKLESQEKAKASCVFKVFLKDEPVKLKKIYEVPKTRTIAAAPLDFQIVYRQYLHSAQAWMASNWHILPPKVGINPLSLDYNTLYNAMAAVSTEASDLDFEGWDFCIHPFLLEQLPRFWNIIYRRCDPNWKEEDDAMRNVLYSKVVKFLILVGNSIFQTTGGIPSGYPGTTPDNSVINDLIGYVAYLKLVVKRNPCLSSISTFRQDVCTATYGDDVLRSISELIMHLYNSITLSDYFKTLGFKPTPASKEGQMVAHRPLIECLFLSREFRLWGSYMVGPLLLEHLRKPTWWVHDNRSHHFWESPDEVCRNAETIRGCYDSILYEASLHPKQVFDEFYTAALQVWKDYGGERPLTQSECQARMFNIATNLSNTFVPGVIIASEPDILNMSTKHVPINVVSFKNRKSWHFGPKYTYSGVTHPSVPIPITLTRILEYINYVFNKNFNSVLVNQYEPGGCIPWHRDDEIELDVTEGVACLTVTGNGKMEWKSSSGERYARYMSPGDIYLMTEANLLNFSHRRVDHTNTTCTFTFRKLDS